MHCLMKKHLKLSRVNVRRLIRIRDSWNRLDCLNKHWCNDLFKFILNKSFIAKIRIHIFKLINQVNLSKDYILICCLSVVDINSCEQNKITKVYRIKSKLFFYILFLNGKPLSFWINKQQIRQRKIFKLNALIVRNEPRKSRRLNPAKRAIGRAFPDVQGLVER